MERLDVDIELWRGEFRLALTESFALQGITAIFGASGSGKTSLLRVIAGLELNAAGTIAMRGERWLGPGHRVPPEARAIGYVFQDGRLFEHLNVRANLKFPIRHGGRRSPIDFDTAVDALDLAPLLARHPHSLLGGEIQRVAIARALLAAPALLLMDEPLSSLDLARKRELVPLIKSLAARFELPILYVTHDIDELSYLADHVVMLADGSRVASGSPQQVMATADFARLSEIDDPGAILEATIETQEGALTVATLDGGRIRIPRVSGEPGAKIRLHVSPRDVILATAKPTGLSIRNRLDAVIEALESRADGSVTVRIAVGDQQLAARVTREAVQDLGLGIGQRVYALIKSVALDAFGPS
jgi:molybdate transport system ATP-binding protein